MWQETQSGAPRPAACPVCVATANFSGGMALAADLGPRRLQEATVRVVAIGADDAFRVHLALQEGGVVEDLLAHLSVGLEEIGREEGRQVRVGERARRGASPR